MRLAKIDWLLAGILMAMTVAVTACGSSGKSTAGLPTKIGNGEGQLNLIGWEGYAQPEWVKPFEKQTGCVVHTKYAGSSDEMVTLMRQGGGRTYDMVSASGDATLRLVSGGNVQPVNTNLVPEWKNFIPQLQSPRHNTVNGVHYGVSLQWGPNSLLYNASKVPQAPTSWGAIYNPRFKGAVTVPANPIQIADAALYLSKTQPSLGIADPYELTEAQLNAAVNLLKQQRPLVKKYWGGAADEAELFKNGDVLIGAAWPLATNTLEADKVPVKELIPVEGATGWADTWMISSHTKHLNCAYKWINTVSTPQVQAQQAISFGETPANRLACPYMEKIKKGSCVKYHANAPSAYFESIKFWKTPVKDCGNGKHDCTDFSAWQKRWTEVTA
jgi:putative spermidine/putrescine transport system substrate-binding protein